jgi:phosphate transport system protein
MSHHFVDLLEELKLRIAKMSALVQQAAEQACDALLSGDARLAEQVIQQDAAIDAWEVELEQQAIDLLARHQPAAGDLRLICSVIKVNSDFERIADCAVNVAQRVTTLNEGGRFNPSADLRLLCGTVTSTLRDTIKAFNLADEQLAKQVLYSDDLIDSLYHQIVQDVLTTMESPDHRANRDLAVIMVAKNLERIGDHCTNIAEDIVYVHSGQIIRHRKAV